MRLSQPIGSRLASLVLRFPWVARSLFRVRYGRFGAYLAEGLSIPSWLGVQEGLALATFAYSLRPNAIIVEIGSFLGKSAILLAGARKLRGSGTLHCIDPFDASGDTFSTPVYRSIAAAEARSLRERFDANIARAGLAAWVEVHQGTAVTVAASWNTPIDMLFLDGDQSPDGARIAFQSWEPYLRADGIIALHNSTSRTYAPDHNGIHLLATGVLRKPQFSDISAVETTTFARKVF
jgi:predicted O-methyltransferase YrrM